MKVALCWLWTRIWNRCCYKVLALNSKLQKSSEAALRKYRMHGKWQNVTASSTNKSCFVCTSLWHVMFRHVLNTHIIRLFISFWNLCHVFSKAHQPHFKLYCWFPVIFQQTFNSLHGNYQSCKVGYDHCQGSVKRYRHVSCPFEYGNYEASL